MFVKELTVKIKTEFICSYEDYHVFAIYLNGKFSRMLTVKYDQ
jgi:hypothetical protein